MNIAEIQDWAKAPAASGPVGTIILNEANLAVLFAQVFPESLSANRLRHNPPPERAEVLDALRKAARGATSAELPGRAAFYLRNAGCITERRIWRDGGRERLTNLTPQGACLLTALEAQAEHPCLRCGGTGVIEDQTRYGAFMVPDLLPCPECQRQESEPPLPF